MFTNYVKPFYAQATSHELKPIALEKLYTFIKEKFENYMPIRY
jgi:hypothetical protein